MVLYYGQKIEKKYYPVTVYKYRGNFIKGHQQHYDMPFLLSNDFLTLSSTLLMHNNLQKGGRKAEKT